MSSGAPATSSTGWDEEQRGCSSTSASTSAPASAGTAECRSGSAASSSSASWASVGGGESTWPVICLVVVALPWLPLGKCAAAGRLGEHLPRSRCGDSKAPPVLVLLVQLPPLLLLLLLRWTAATLTCSDGMEVVAVVVVVADDTCPFSAAGTGQACMPDGATRGISLAAEGSSGADVDASMDGGKGVGDT